jgi:hypothetical protein
MTAMQYFVLGSDGKEYGPADVDTLKLWVADGRLAPTTQLRDASTGQIMPASTIGGLFVATPPVQAANYSQPPTQSYMAPNFAAKPASTYDNSASPLISAIFSSVLGLVFFFFLHGIGLIVTGFAIARAVQAQASGNKYGIACIAITVLAFCAIGVGWLLGLNGR